MRNNWSSCLFALPIFAATWFVSSGIFVQPAEACTPPNLGWTVSNIWSDGNFEIPANDGAIVISAVDGGGDYDLSFAVTDDSGEEIEGTVDYVERTQVETSPKWLDCPPEEVTTPYFVVWMPDTPLSVGSEYDVEITTESASASGGIEETDRQERQFTAVSDPTADLPAPTIDEPELSTATSGNEYTCCECESCCGLCETDDGQHCWYVSELMQPQAVADIGGPDDARTQQVIYRALDADEEADEMPWKTTPQAEIIYDLDDEGPYCFRVEAQDLATGETALSDEVCLENSEELVFEERSTDPGWPAECDDDPPVDEGDSDDTTGSDIGVADAGSDDAGPSDTDSAGGCGCSSTKGGGHSWLFLFALVVISVRFKSNLRGQAG